ncbi:hypothetical protein B9S53_00025 [Arthrospira sp. O9.13F]|nr:hypothetical protein B9S53_00025 [Arthrospira sp. O9.13F]
MTPPPRAGAGGESFIRNCWHYGQVGDKIKHKITSKPAPLQVKLISMVRHRLIQLVPGDG